MPSFLLVVFLVQLGIHLINTIGAATFSQWVRARNSMISYCSAVCVRPRDYC